MKISKRLITLLMVLSMILLSTKVKVLAANEQTDYIVVTEDIVKEIAVNWAEYIKPELSFDTSKIYEYYGYDNNIIGYSVSLVSNDIPYGYVLIDFFAENYISEFVIEEGKMNICETALFNSEIEFYSMEYGVASNYSSLINPNIKLHKYLPVASVVSIQVNDEELFITNNEILTQKEYGEFNDPVVNQYTLSRSSRSNDQTSTIYNHCGDIMISKVPTGYASVDVEKRLSSTQSISQSWCENYAGSYACAIVAGTNIIRQNISTAHTLNTYNWLWTDTGTKETESSKNDTSVSIIYGATTVGKIAPSVVKYAKSLGKTSSSYSTLSSPSYSNYKTAIDASKSAVLEYGVTVNSSDSTTERQGHTVSVIGYRSDRDAGNSLHQYIIIADSWGNYKYVDMSTADFLDKAGATIVIK